MKTLVPYCVSFCLSLVFFSVNAQVNQQRFLDSTMFASKLDSIRETCSYRKAILPQYETEILTVLSFYPELDSTRIIFKEATIKASLNARPKVGSLFFRRRKNRTYVIRIKPNTEDSVATLSQAGFNAAVGVLGHELNHVVDYSNRNIFGIIGRLFNYTNKKGKRKYEAEIDRMTIEKGLGWQLFDWEDYVFNKSNAKVRYKAYKKDIYYSPEDLKRLINKKSPKN